MRYDREMEHARIGGRRGRGELLGRGEYGAGYEAPYRAHFHGYGMGYAGGALRSRGSYEAGQLRSGLNPVDEFEFDWGEGYVGGRGYGGTNYDYEHGYLVGGVPRYPGERPTQAAGRAPTSPATRGGYAWGEYPREMGELYGPVRYGYGPYHERLRRPRRSDEDVRKEVEDALYYDTWVDADAIDVRVENGVVTLSGTLPSYDEVRYATDDAWDVDGVRGVRIELNVREQAERAPERAARRRAGEAGVAVTAETAATAAAAETRGGAGPGGPAESRAKGGRGGRRSVGTARSYESPPPERSETESREPES